MTDDNRYNSVPRRIFEKDQDRARDARKRINDRITDYSLMIKSLVEEVAMIRAEFAHEMDLLQKEIITVRTLVTTKGTFQLHK